MKPVKKSGVEDAQPRTAVESEPDDAHRLVPTNDLLIPAADQAQMAAPLLVDAPAEPNVMRTAYDGGEFQLDGTTLWYAPPGRDTRRSSATDPCLLPTGSGRSHTRRPWTGPWPTSQVA
jgi:hypothetical protein